MLFLTARVHSYEGYYKKMATLTETDEVVIIQPPKLLEFIEPSGMIVHGGCDFRRDISASLSIRSANKKGAKDTNPHEPQAVFARGLDCIGFGRKYICNVCAFRGVWEVSDKGVVLGR